MSPDIQPNPECESCPCFGPGNPCTRIFRAWKHHQTVRRPELVRLLTTMASQHLEAHCHAISPSIDEIEQRPSVKSYKRPIAGDKKPEVVKPVPAEPVKTPVPAIMIGRMPRNKFSLREGR